MKLFSLVSGDKPHQPASNIKTAEQFFFFKKA